MRTLLLTASSVITLSGCIPDNRTIEEKLVDACITATEDAIKSVAKYEGANTSGIEGVVMGDITKNEAETTRFNEKYGHSNNKKSAYYDYEVGTIGFTMRNGLGQDRKSSSTCKGYVYLFEDEHGKLNKDKVEISSFDVYINGRNMYGDSVR